MSRKNPNCQQTLRSEAAVTNEKNRHVRSPDWYVIHPFSEFCMIRETVATIIWIYVFFKDPFVIAFLPSHKRIDVLAHNIFEGLSDFLLGLYSFSCFFTGK